MFNIIWITTKWNLKDIKPVIELIEFLLKEGKRVFISQHAQKSLEGTKYSKLDSVDYSKKIDLYVVFWWDWSILRVNRNLQYYDAKILCINMWKLWFMSALSPEGIIENIKLLFAWNYTLDERSLIDVTVFRWNKEIINGQVLNELVISYKDISRIIFIKAKADGCVIANYASDWLIISTPTWSTAYNISAWWPILFPKIPAFILTPICSHSFTQKPIVIPDNTKLSFELMRENKEKCSLTLDGQVVHTVQMWDIINAKKFKDTFKFIRLSWENFYKTIKNKLHWWKEKI